MKKFDDKYMQITKLWALNSHAIRAKVGALVVKDNMIISDGFNGTPTGMPNACEKITCMFYKDCKECASYQLDELSCVQCQNAKLETLPTVIHAECNAITKLAKSTQSSEGATLFVTLSPCIECAKMIIQSGIKRVVYEQKYRNDDGLRLLEEAGIEIEQYTIN